MTDDNAHRILTELAKIEERVSILPDIDRRTRAIENGQATITQRLKDHDGDIERNEADIKALETRSYVWDGLNSFGALLAAIFAALTGSGKP